MDLKNKFMEAAQRKFPKRSNNALEDTVLLRVLAKKDIEQLLETEVDTEKAEKITSLAGGITISELEETIESFPLLRKEQILRFFKTETLASPKALLDSAAITRPQLITLVETLEDYTGLKVTDESQAPLRYLDEKSSTLTIEDVAEFFSHCPSRIITIQAAREHSAPAMSAKTKSYKRHLVKSYLSDCCAMKDEEIDEKQPITSLVPDVEAGKDSYLVVVWWMESRFNKCVNNAFIEQKTIGDLIDFFAKNEKKSL